MPNVYDMRRLSIQARQCGPVGKCIITRLSGRLLNVGKRGSLLATLAPNWNCDWPNAFGDEVRRTLPIGRRKVPLCASVCAFLTGLRPAIWLTFATNLGGSSEYICIRGASRWNTATRFERPRRLGCRRCQSDVRSAQWSVTCLTEASNIPPDDRAPILRTSRRRIVASCFETRAGNGPVGLSHQPIALHGALPLRCAGNQRRTVPTKGGEAVT
jgi:hypothetical protein